MRYERILTRSNGDIVKIVTEINLNLRTGQDEIDNYILTRRQGATNWQCYGNGYRNRSASMTMSVDEYLRNGRPPMLTQVSTGELLSANHKALQQYHAIARHAG